MSAFTNTLSQSKIFFLLTWYIYNFVFIYIYLCYYIYIYLLFKDILIHWLKLGISGFRLANTSFLTEDPLLHNEARSLHPVEINNYHSLMHVYTRDRPENAAVLTKWQEIVRNETDGKGYVCFYAVILRLHVPHSISINYDNYTVDYSRCKTTLVRISCKFTMRRRQ